jgi:hypothetical protein
MPGVTGARSDEEWTREVDGRSSRSSPASLPPSSPPPAEKGSITAGRVEEEGEDEVARLERELTPVQSQSQGQLQETRGRRRRERRTGVRILMDGRRDVSGRRRRKERRREGPALSLHPYPPRLHPYPTRSLCQRRREALQPAERRREALQPAERIHCRRRRRRRERRRGV